MKLTDEQIAILNSNGNIKINAVAGSGKTTTVIEFAKTKPETCRILYLAFNKSVRLEAQQKFAKNNLRNVRAETAHSLAYKYIVRQNGFKIRAHGYRASDLIDILKIGGGDQKHGEYIFANHILKFAAYYCNSDVREISNLDYLETITEPKAREFVKFHYQMILRGTRAFLSRMESGKIECTHDFYLKKFQLSDPQLPFDYILFDEGQDASAAMLDVFLKQKATKVIVGDAHQQIYGWRHAVNSLAKADYPTFTLSNSFRFGEGIAKLAEEIILRKNHLNSDSQIKVFGKGKISENQSRAVIARTNLGLLLKAIEMVTDSNKLGKIYFEGNINSYTYADEGASLYDVLNLYNRKNYNIRDSLIKKMSTLSELEDFIEKTEDAQLGMMVEIVKEYGNEIPQIIKKIKEKHIDSDDKSEAEIIFSTVHRCKGMEYGTVQIVNDFLTEEQVKKLKQEDKIRNQAKLNEEINLLYVAVTRAKNRLFIPETLMPENFPSFPEITVLKSESLTEKPKETVKQYSATNTITKSYTVEQVRETHAAAYQPWTPELDAELTEMFSEGINLRDLAKHFGRTKGAISSRIKKLEIFD